MLPAMGLRSRPRWVKRQEEEEALAPLRAWVHRFLHTNLRLVVCGGRYYDDRATVWAVLDRIHRLRGISEVIEGGAHGVDTFAGEWADARRVRRTTVPADWKTHGRAAGPLRNMKMLAKRPHGVLAFPGGRGTADCVAQTRAVGIIVWEPLKRAP
jgi:hypothetical protein